MKRFNQIIGNLHDPEWAKLQDRCQIERLDIDQWTAQKERFVIHTNLGNNYMVALENHHQICNGDILDYDAEKQHLTIIYIRLNELMVLHLKNLRTESLQQAMQTCVALGIAIGGEHWQTVIKEDKIYIPLTDSKQKMENIVRTHQFMEVEITYVSGEEIISELEPYEVRRLFGTPSKEEDDLIESGATQEPFLPEKSSCNGSKDSTEFCLPHPSHP